MLEELSKIISGQTSKIFAYRNEQLLKRIWDGRIIFQSSGLNGSMSKRYVAMSIWQNHPNLQERAFLVIKQEKTPVRN